MREKREFKRLPINLHLSISDLFRQSSSMISGLDAPIKVVDISKSGIGFISGCVLPENYYFNATLEFGSKHSSLFTVVKIVRSEAIDADHFHYGGEFEGLPRDISEIISQFSISD